MLSAKLSSEDTSNSMGDCLVLTTIPFSLGIETVGGVMSIIAKRGYAKPAKKTLTFSTYTDNQTSVLVQVYHGESSLTKNNLFLAEFLLEGIPPMPRGQPQIDIAMDIDANDAVIVSAIEKSQAIEKKLSICSAAAAGIMFHRLKGADRNKTALIDQVAPNAPSGHDHNSDYCSFWNCY